MDDVVYREMRREDVVTALAPRNVVFIDNGTSRPHGDARLSS
jgi:hypothetical protein